MKIVKFRDYLVPLILSEEKTATRRLFDDKDLSVGDDIELKEFGKEQPFGKAVITEIVIKKFGDLEPKDKDGHEEYSSDQEMYDIYSGYYDTTVGADTDLKIIHFKLVSVY